MLELALGMIGLLGAVGTFYFGMKTMELDRRRRSLTWDQVHSGATQLLRDELLKFKPSAILCTAGPGAGVASIAVSELHAFIPTFMMMYEDLNGEPFERTPTTFESVESSRWRIHVPAELLEDPRRRILIFTDCVISGGTATAVRELFQRRGFAPSNVRYVALVCSQIAKDSNRAPDAYWYLNPHSDFYFPWGRWY